MTSNHKKLLLVALICIVPMVCGAQPGGGPTPPGPVPISEEIIYLLISGILYGFRKKIKKH